MVAFGLKCNSRDHGGDETVRIADYYTHIELVEELIRSYERYYQVRSDRWLFTKRRTITAVGCDHSHPRRISTESLDILEQESTLNGWLTSCKKPSAGKLPLDDDVIDGKVALTAEQLRRKRQDIGMIFQHFNLMTKDGRECLCPQTPGLSKEEKKAK